MEAATQYINDRYELLSALGKGSQGAVYLARDMTLERRVAVKVLNEKNSDLNTMAADGTPQEARIVSKLAHPNIVPIFDAGICDLGPYLVFEYVEGRPLLNIMKERGALSVEQAVPLIADILKAMSAAHAADILHLDLNPRNVLIDSSGMPRIMDFGLAQHVLHERTIKDAAAGTLRYMTPEHFLGRDLNTATDVFALGSVFYELVSGNIAMAGTTIRDVQLMIVSAQLDYDPFRALAHGEAYARFLAGALERKPEGRYANCTVMLEAFTMFLQEAGLADKVGASTARHATIEYLLQRMQRKKDFPSISRTLADINAMTSDDSTATADQLANVILRDFALTGKLLKLVNSAFYGARAVEVTSVSQAVVFLGIEQVRMTANSLTFFGHLNNGSDVLKESMTRAFMSGLIARHLGKRMKLTKAEEAFICGMCQNLGENLVIYYFADEYGEIRELMQARELGKSAASRGVLGVSYADLGASVARVWKLPGTIVDSIIGLPPGDVPLPINENDALRKVAVFANELCDLFRLAPDTDRQRDLQALIARFAAVTELDQDYVFRLMAAGLEKLKQHAPVFEIRVDSSIYCRSVQAWLDHGAQEAQPKHAAG